MALTTTAIDKLKPKDKTYSVSDDGGLYLEVTPLGAKIFKIRFRVGGRGAKQEKSTLGAYPTFSLERARLWRGDCKELIGHGVSPEAVKRSDPLPDDLPASTMKLVESFINNWCQAAQSKIRASEEAVNAEKTVEVFARRWLKEVVNPNNIHPRNIVRILEKDVLPAIGAKQITDITINDVLAISDRIKARGADQMALQTRNVMKRLFAFAISRGVTQFNPAAAIEGKYIATQKSRDVALTPDEIGRLLRAVYSSNIKRANKLALHLLLICMTRKSELIEAQWSEIDLDAGEWIIPAERMKMSKPHVVPLSTQAIAMLGELKGLSSGSAFVFPSRSHLNKPISKSSLNHVVRGLEHDVQSFVLHDFRRTASTHLNEAGFNSDWIEKSLAHTAGGVRAVYNKAEYKEQRRKMMQWWADLVDAQIEDGRGKVIIGQFGRSNQFRG